MKLINSLLLCLLPGLALAAAGGPAAKSLSTDLSGAWHYTLDPQDKGLSDKWFDKHFDHTIQLPGTLDGIGEGEPNRLPATFEAPQIRHLIRRHSYIGPAWYTREVEISPAMAGRTLTLELERVLWLSQLWVDGVAVGTQNSQSTPHRFSFGPLQAGKHRLTLRIDNRAQFDNSVVNMGHHYTDDTQIIWNGVIGAMKLTAVSGPQITRVALFPDATKKQVRIVVGLTLGSGSTADLRFTPSLGGRKLPTKAMKAVFSGKERTVEYTYDFKQIASWSEFSPNVYTMCVEASDGHAATAAEASFGFRTLGNSDGRLTINDRPTFLRGTLECCIFPLTGTPPTDHASWEKLLGTAREWGLNHIRFHSWCPPRAAFEVADRMGFYLQVELPWWSYSAGHHGPTNDYMWQEALAIMHEYGNHPSFCFWSMGNELEGDMAMLDNFVRVLKEQDNRHLYTATSFSFQRGAGSVALPNDDFLIAQWTDKGWVRGQGMFNDEAPCFDKDFDASLDSLRVPLISHEIGQYCVYPNMEEIAKYTGVLEPLNFIAVRNDLQKRGLSHKAQEYLMASGKFAAVLYKEEIERALKTRDFGGFQLLDLHDYPGQGTALVGVLDAFWDSKGLIEPAQWRGFCSEVVPLARFPKAIYEEGECFSAQIEVANFGPEPLRHATLDWALRGSKGWQRSGSTPQLDIELGQSPTHSTLDVALDGITEAQCVEVSIGIRNTSYRNSWKIWVYPAAQPDKADDVVVTRDLEAAKQALAAGRKVLFNPDWRYVNGIEGMFLPVFWSPVHFPNQAGTMGILCNPAHPALTDFPTDMHSDWQWWDLVKNSKTLVLDSLPPVRPIVEVVDNFLKNRRLATVFEARVGNGSLLLVTHDISGDLGTRPAARALRHSLLNYMHSPAFAPECNISATHIDALILPTADDTRSSSTRIYN